MARKEIKIFMDAKEAASFLKTIDWSWLFGFLSERYNVSLSPHKELKDNGAAIIKVEWPDELIEKCGMTNPTKTFSYLDCDGVVKERTLALNISLRYTLYDGGYNFATLLYAVYSDVNGWTVQMKKE